MIGELTVGDLIKILQKQDPSEVVIIISASENSDID